MFNRNSCFAFMAGLALLGQALVAQAQTALPDFKPLVESASPAVVNGSDAGAGGIATDLS